MAGVARPFYIVKSFLGHGPDVDKEVDAWMNDNQRSGYDLTNISTTVSSGVMITTVVMNVRPRKKKSEEDDE